MAAARLFARLLFRHLDEVWYLRLELRLFSPEFGIHLRKRRPVALALARLGALAWRAGSGARRARKAATSALKSGPKKRQRAHSAKRNPTRPVTRWPRGTARASHASRVALNYAGRAVRRGGAAVAQRGGWGGAHLCERRDLELKVHAELAERVARVQQPVLVLLLAVLLVLRAAHKERRVSGRVARATPTHARNARRAQRSGSARATSVPSCR